MGKRIVVVAAAVTLGCNACASSNSAHTAGTTGASTQRPTFVARVDNPWFPLRPGTTWVYRGIKDGKRSRDVVRVLAATRVIDGVRCTAVSDRLFLNGRLGERTIDWYAQDADGTVWYFGEATAELNAAGRVTSTEGSWRSGVDGAKAGVFMPANPRVGQSFRQEYFRGHAEDHFEVLRVAARRLLTKEWTPLEPDVLDHKLYARGTGLVDERTVKGGDERATLLYVRGR